MLSKLVLVAMMAAIAMASPVQFNIKIPPQYRVEYIKFSECGSRDYIKNLDLKVPNPLTLPGNINFYLSADIVKDIPNTDVNVKLWKKVGLWLIIPCLFDIGSCKYKDICSLMTTGGDSAQIGEMFETIGWNYCPFTGEYRMNPAGYDIEVPEIPSFLDWLATGSYKTEVTLLKPGEKKENYFCIKGEFKIKSGSQ